MLNKLSPWKERDKQLLSYTEWQPPALSIHPCTSSHFIIWRRTAWGQGADLHGYLWRFFAHLCKHVYAQNCLASCSCCKKSRAWHLESKAERQKCSRSQELGGGEARKPQKHICKAHLPHICSVLLLRKERAWLQYCSGGGEIRRRPASRCPGPSLPTQHQLFEHTTTWIWFASMFRKKNPNKTKNPTLLKSPVKQPLKIKSFQVVWGVFFKQNYLETYIRFSCCLHYSHWQNKTTTF